MSRPVRPFRARDAFEGGTGFVDGRNGGGSGPIDRRIWSDKGRRFFGLPVDDTPPPDPDPGEPGFAETVTGLSSSGTTSFSFDPTAYAHAAQPWTIQVTVTASMTFTSSTPGPSENTMYYGGEIGGGQVWMPIAYGFTNPQTISGTFPPVSVIWVPGGADVTISFGFSGPASWTATADILGVA